MTISKMLNDLIVDQYDYGVDVCFKLNTKTGTPFELEGYDAQFIIKENKNDLDEKAIYNKSFVCEKGNTIVIPIDSVLSSNKIGNYFYAIRLMKNGVYVNTVIQARFYIKDNTFETGVQYE